MLKNFFYGKIDLPQSFWIYFFIVNTLLALVARTFTSTYGQPPIFIGMLFFFSIQAYKVFSIVGTWRSATNNYKKYKGWSSFAKVILSLGIVDVIFRIGIVIVAMFSGSL